MIYCTCTALVPNARGQHGVISCILHTPLIPFFYSVFLFSIHFFYSAIYFFPLFHPTTDKAIVSFFIIKSMSQNFKRCLHKYLGALQKKGTEEYSFSFDTEVPVISSTAAEGAGTQHHGSK